MSKLSGQTSLGLEKYVAEATTRRALSDADAISEAVLEWFGRAVHAIGFKEVVDALDTNKTTLSLMMKGDEERALREPWVNAVLHMSSPSMREEYLRLKCHAFDFETERRKKMTDKEHLDALRVFMRKRAPDVLDAFDREVMS